ncbi:MAG TPA: carboxypeptidase regulatory-like domain-containing protein [Roseiflexaceae bacterium]|nr:carboxypeptidase regulatory-like domain-containing protein [Roseiflexaceae bacterium]
MMKRSCTLLFTFVTVALLVGSMGVLRPTVARAAPAAASCVPDSGSATISGTVTDPASMPVKTVLVTAYTSYGDRGGYAYTDASGVYQITGLIGGSYILKFEPQSGDYATEWYNNKPDPQDATPVVVADGGAVTGINAQLDPGARFSGQVSGVGGGGLSGVSVSVYDAAGQRVASAYSDATGVYTTSPGLPSGSYRIQFDRAYGFLSSFYNDKPTLETADAIAVTAPELRTGINAVLARGGAINGKVSDAATGLPLTNIAISANGENGSGYDYTDATGTYTITGLATGAYSVTAAPVFDDVNLIGAPQSATVVAPNTTANVNFTLAAGGTITGRVTGPGGTPLKDITVFVGNQDGSYQNYVYTNATGVYTATGLPSGQYKVLFRPSAYIPEAYNNKPDFGDADPISVTAPNTVTGIDAMLDQGSAVSGKVTDASTGLPVKDVFVEVLDQNGQRVETAFTQADGSYQTEPTLPSGSYKVRFNADERFASCAYVTAYYNNKTSVETADQVVVSAPNPMTNINAALNRGSIIFGKVTDAASGAPITSGQVTVYDAAGEFVMFGRLSFLGGWHTETGLPSGSYRVKFSDTDGGYIDEFYNDKPSLASATPITLSAPTDHVGIDAALAKGATISGRVTAADTAAPFTQGTVVVYDTDGAEVGSAFIEEDGSYHVPNGLASGNYRVGVIPYDAEGEGELSAASARGVHGAVEQRSPYTVTYYRNTGLLASATPVALTAPTATTGIDIAMLRGTWLPLTQR